MHIHQELEGFYSATRGGLTHALEINVMTEITKRELRSAAMGRQEVPSSFVLLILEDFDEIRAFLSRHFAEHGYDVFSSSTLRDALAIVWEEDPHLVVIDYDLNGESAMHAIERIHHARPASYIVLIGGPGSLDVEERALEAGASKVLSKEYAISEMENIVNSVMNQFFQEERAFS